MDITNVLVEALKTIPSVIVGGYPVKVIVDLIKSKWQPESKLIPWLASLTGGVIGVFYSISGVPQRPESMEVWLFMLIWFVAGLLSGQVARVYWDNSKSQIINQSVKNQTDKK